MDEKIMKLWSVSSVSEGRRHTAIVQDVDMYAAIVRYCGMFPTQASKMVTIQGRALQFNRFDDFGKLAPGIAEIP